MTITCMCQQLVPFRTALLAAAAVLLLWPAQDAAAEGRPIFGGNALIGKHAGSLEIRFGGALHDTGLLTQHDTGGVVANGEVLLPSPGFLAPVGAPRPYVGGSYAFVDDGATAIQFIYAGLNWQVHWTDRFYTGFSVGGALNNADLSWDSPNWGIGCNQSFHLALSAGVDVTERVSVEAFANHFSNANLCYSNGGHEDAGLRIGFRF